MSVRYVMMDKQKNWLGDLSQIGASVKKIQNLMAHAVLSLYDKSDKWNKKNPKKMTRQNITIPWSCCWQLLQKYEWISFAIVWKRKWSKKLLEKITKTEIFNLYWRNKRKKAAQNRKGALIMKNRDIGF